MNRRVVLSGIRPTAEDQHLGNYLGAIRHFVALSKKEDLCFYFIADLHALTTAGTSFDPEGIRRGRNAIVLNLLAAGIEPEHSVIYTQSAIPELTELSWILSCLAPVNHLQTMHHWDEKRDRLSALGMEANAGLLTYPVLMAADILAPRADIVPVGKDQHQHVEFAREIARAFNRITNRAFFTVPELHERDEATVKSLKNPGEKMGKSDPEGCLFMNDSESVLRTKLDRAVTDPARKRRTDPGNPDVCNIYSLHQQVSPGAMLADVREGCTSARIGCRDCKRMLGTQVNAVFEPIRERRLGFADGADELAQHVLEEGGRKARSRIAETVETAKDLMGLAPHIWR